MTGNHPLRASLSEEMHVRRLPVVAAPCRLMQIVATFGEGGVVAARAHIDRLAASGRAVVAISAKYAIIEIGAFSLVWELHSEFSSYTLLAPGPFETLFDPARFEPLLSQIRADMPGKIVRATQIALTERGAPEPGETERSTWFNAESTVICDVADGTARIASDFRLNEDGYGRLLIMDLDLAGNEPAQLIQRLQELGNYRNMALLGLPVAQEMTPVVTALEARLAELTQAVSERTTEDDRLLDELTFLSAELARMMTATRYRMSATRAYAQISVDRLASLQIAAVRGFQTLADFTERRLMPAVRTCESFSARLEDLSQRTSWTSELLRTRIDIALAKQNRDLLASMDQRTSLQLRLQLTVEGLSIVAISYYLVALVGYVVKPLTGLPQEVAMAAAVPLALAGVALAIRRVRRKLHA